MIHDWMNLFENFNFLWLFALLVIVLHYYLDEEILLSKEACIMFGVSIPLIYHLFKVLTELSKWSKMSFGWWYRLSWGGGSLVTRWVTFEINLLSSLSVYEFTTSFVSERIAIGLAYFSFGSLLKPRSRSFFLLHIKLYPQYLFS